MEINLPGRFYLKRISKLGIYEALLQELRESKTILVQFMFFNQTQSDSCLV